MRPVRVTLTELVLKGLMCFSIFTVIQGISVFDDINKIWMAVVSMILLLRIMKYRFTISQVIMVFLTIIVHIFAFYYTEFPLYHVNMLFYFLLWVMLYFFFAKSKVAIIFSLGKANMYIEGILWCWTLLVGFSALLPSSYVNRYFVSFSGTSFRLMPATLIITALTMYMVNHTKKKRYNLFLILPIYVAFMNHSRTYFGVFILFLLMHIYMQFKNKKQFYFLLIPIAGALLFLISVSGIADKLRSSQYDANSYFDFWGTITSGRTVFWVWDLEAFFGLPFLQQFVGNGFNFVYDVNGFHMNAIWAHNDIINLLMNFGYIGVLVYYWVFFMMINAFWPKGNSIPRFIKLMFHGAVFINSMFNMSYTYLCAMISYPFFLCAVSEKYTSE